MISVLTIGSLYWSSQHPINRETGYSNVLPVVQIYKPVDGMHKGSIQEWDRWCNTLYKKIPRRRQSSQIQLNAMHCNAIGVNWMQMQSNAMQWKGMRCKRARGGGGSPVWTLRPATTRRRSGRRWPSDSTVSHAAALTPDKSDAWLIWNRQ